jgi:thioredoxin 1
MSDDELEEIRVRKKKELLERLSGGGAPAEGSAATSGPDRPINLDDSSMDEAIKSNPLLVVDCWAEWCAPCRMVAPVIEELARKLKGKVVFGKLDVDHNPRTASKYQIMSIPAMLVFKGGKFVDMFIGYMPANALEQKLSKYL